MMSSLTKVLTFCNSISSGRVVDSRSNGCEFETHRRQCVACRQDTLFSAHAAVVQPGKIGTRLEMAEILLIGAYSVNTNYSFIFLNRLIQILTQLSRFKVCWVVFVIFSQNE